MLVGHQQRLNVEKLLEMLLGVDDGAVLVVLADGFEGVDELRLGELISEFFVWISSELLVCSLKESW